MRHVSVLFDRKASLDLVKEKSKQFDFRLRTIRARLIVDAHLDSHTSFDKGLCHVHVPGVRLSARAQLLSRGVEPPSRDSALR